MYTLNFPIQWYRPLFCCLEAKNSKIWPPFAPVMIQLYVVSQALSLGSLGTKHLDTLLFVFPMPSHSSALQTKPQFCLSSNPPAAGLGDNF